MKRDGWSLSNRVTWVVAGTMVLMLACAFAISFSFARPLLAGRFDSLTREELDEMSTYFSVHPLNHEKFNELAQTMIIRHPDATLRFGYREGGQAWTWCPAPPTGQDLDESGYPLGTNASQRLLTSTIHYPVPENGDDQALDLAVFLDGSALMSSTAELGTRLLLILGLAALAGMGPILLLHRRVSNLLSNVAQAARLAAEDPDAMRDATANAPREVAAIMDALQDRLAQLRKENDHSHLLIAGLAHDLRSPVQVVLGEAEVTLMRTRTAEEYRTSMETISEELRDLSGVLENLMMLVGRQRGMAPRATEKFDLNREADLRLSRERAWAKRMEVQLMTRSEGKLEYTGDRESVLLALRNLVRNALDHAPQGSRIQITLMGDESRVQISVEDEGPGIPLAQRERVLAPFTTCDTPGRTRRTGGGLGLALVKQAADEHGGSMRIDDSPSLGGARVSLDLPRP